MMWFALREALRALLGDARGGTAVIFALGAPALALLACGAIDLVNVGSDRSAMQDTADKIALALCTGQIGRCLIFLVAGFDAKLIYPRTLRRRASSRHNQARCAGDQGNRAFRRVQICRGCSFGQVVPGPGMNDLALIAAAPSRIQGNFATR